MSTVQESLLLGPELAGSLMTPEEFDAAEIGDELYELPVSRLLAESDMLEQAELHDPEE
ncbi:MAG: hypothetical protein MUE50_18555 [Pirellulaceae bacterium]|jgi:hypothetical protein|nr:hypothetical protein [Pirellulaceae bacterium]MCU0979100.1 hypothetical protein [Pirellulaceae bacterium]